MILDSDLMLIVYLSLISDAVPSAYFTPFALHHTLEWGHAMILGTR